MSVHMELSDDECDAYYAEHLPYAYGAGRGTARPNAGSITTTMPPPEDPESGSMVEGAPDDSECIHVAISCASNSLIVQDRDVRNFVDAMPREFRMSSTTTNILDRELTTSTLEQRAAALRDFIDDIKPHIDRSERLYRARTPIFGDSILVRGRPMYVARSPCTEAWNDKRSIRVNGTRSVLFTLLNKGTPSLRDWRYEYCHTFSRPDQHVEAPAFGNLTVHRMLCSLTGTPPRPAAGGGGAAAPYWSNIIVALICHRHYQTAGHEQNETVYLDFMVQTGPHCVRLTPCVLQPPDHVDGAVACSRERNHGDCCICLERMTNTQPPRSLHPTMKGVAPHAVCAQCFAKAAESGKCAICRQGILTAKERKDLDRFIITALTRVSSFNQQVHAPYVTMYDRAIVIRGVCADLTLSSEDAALFAKGDQISADLQRIAIKFALRHTKVTTALDMLCAYVYALTSLRPPYPLLYLRQDKDRSLATLMREVEKCVAFDYFARRFELPLYHGLSTDFIQLSDMIPPREEHVRSVYETLREWLIQVWGRKDVLGLIPTIVQHAALCARDNTIPFPGPDAVRRVEYQSAQHDTLTVLRAIVDTTPSLLGGSHTSMVMHRHDASERKRKRGER